MGATAGVRRPWRRHGAPRQPERMRAMARAERHGEGIRECHAYGHAHTRCRIGGSGEVDRSIDSMNGGQRNVVERWWLDGMRSWRGCACEVVQTVELEPASAMSPHRVQVP